jgi:hypothetical protein
MKPYSKRLAIDLNGNSTLLFFSKSNLHLSTGYVRVVIGGRGPYVEFTDRQLQMQNVTLPEEEEYRIDDRRTYYVEYRSKCDSYVKIYVQKRTVAYADYKIGYCYISPFDLMMASTCPVISA